MKKQISGTELVNSSMNSIMGSSIKRLKGPTRVKSKVSKYFVFMMNEAGVIVSKTHLLFVNTTSRFCGNTNLSYH